MRPIHLAPPTATPSVPAAVIALLTVAPTSLTQETPSLAFTDGVLGSQVRYEPSGTDGYPYALLISLEQGPTPLSLFVPGSDLVLDVGLDLLQLSVLATIPDPTTYSLPSTAALEGQTLHGQFLTVDATLDIVLSETAAFTLGRPGFSSRTLEDGFESRLGHTLTTSADGGSAFLLGGYDRDPTNEWQPWPTPGDATQYFNSGERYLSESQSFAYLPQALQTPRGEHTATLLDDGNILVLGGISYGAGPIADAEIFGSSVQVPPMSTTRIHHTATKLDDGRVLVVGGSSSSAGQGGLHWGALTSTEVYDPATNQWTPGPDLGVATWGHTATLLPSGRVLVVGGQISYYNVTSLCGIYDPTTNGFVPAPSLPYGRAFHTATSLDDGRVLVAGGDYLGPIGGTAGSSWVSATAGTAAYDEATGQWTTLGSLTHARAVHDAVKEPGTGHVVVSGGVGAWYSKLIPGLDGNPVGAIERFDPSTGQWSTLGSMVDSRIDVDCALVDGGLRLLTTGGVPIEGAFPLTDGFAELLIL